MREQHPQMQIQQSQTPAITKKAIEAANAAQAAADQQAQMMRQVLTMFSPQAANGGQSLGTLMQPTQAPQQMAGGAAGQKPNPRLPPTSGPGGPPVDQQPEAGPPAVPPRSQARA